MIQHGLPCHDVEQILRHDKVMGRAASEFRVCLLKPRDLAPGEHRVDTGAAALSDLLLLRLSFIAGIAVPGILPHHRRGDRSHAAVSRDHRGSLGSDRYGIYSLCLSRSSADLRHCMNPVLRILLHRVSWAECRLILHLSAEKDCSVLIDKRPSHAGCTHIQYKDIHSRPSALSLLYVVDGDLIDLPVRRKDRRMPIALKQQAVCGSRALIDGTIAIRTACRVIVKPEE